jgi:CheY-like chemotaxis protein
MSGQAAARSASIRAKGAPDILVVDDDVDAREVLCILLEAEGYRTASAVSGADALELLTDMAPSLILLDLMMPGMSGLQVFNVLKADAKLASIPVLFVSASVESLGAGVQFLQKPVAFDALLEVVREHCTRASSPNLPF